MFVRKLWIAILVLLLICTNISEAQNTTQCSSSCGDIHNINFPFRLKADPGNCGDSRYELDCQNNRTIISLNSRKYNVLEINYDTFLIRVIDPGLEHQRRNCTSFPNYFTTTYPDTPTFGYGVSIIPVIYVNCLATVNSSRYVETTFCGSQNQTSTTSNSSQSHSYVAIGQDMSISDLAESCSLEKVAWASAIGLSGDNSSLSSIGGALSYGFELSWKRTFLCRECEASQGSCFAEGDGFTCSHRCYDDTGFDLPLPCSIHYYGVLTILYGGIVIVSILSFRLLFGLVFLTALIVRAKSQATSSHFCPMVVTLVPPRFYWIRITSLCNWMNHGESSANVCQFRALKRVWAYICQALPECQYIRIHYLSPIEFQLAILSNSFTLPTVVQTSAEKCGPDYFSMCPFFLRRLSRNRWSCGAKISCGNPNLDSSSGVAVQKT
ncbi:hypothetical protein HAX54_021925 [Datura stramonium]|uniref:non-specific serine/threonine protein kinase n=1 Tax=Datura stramonium TaxID=4076 RepID=A0ABS8UVB8_DATST|nr:hypothetical protein [Datura stramonium]